MHNYSKIPDDKKKSSCLLCGYDVLQIIDGISTFITLFMLLYTLYQGISGDFVEFCYYETRTFWSSGEIKTMSNAISNYKYQLENTCIKDNLKVYDIQRTWGNVTYTGTYVPYRSSCFEPYILLSIVFSISFIFQLQRTVCFSRDGETTNNFHRNIGLYVPSDGPQIVRWMEYALTSPLEIILIASSFFIADYVVFLLLACLQGALILLGYLIEILMQVITQDNHDDNKKSLLRKIVWYIFASALVFHGIIWWSIIDRYNREFDGYQDCTNQTTSERTRDIRFIVGIIVWSQFVLFSGFGLVQFRQLYKFTTMQKQDTNTISEEWRFSTFLYSIFSVGSKSVLGFAFISFVQMSQ